MRRRVVAAALLVLAACSRSEERAATVEPAASAEPAPRSTAVAPPLVLARGIRIVKAAADPDAAHLIRAEREKAAGDGRRLIVYVGAKWCEPCQRFHHAAERGELDDAFPDLTVLEFDLDEDRDRIVRAGYGSKLIPLFVLPGDDGRASERRFEGGVKGDGAVSNIIPRLRGLLAK
jgi:thiol-disulfide isomerase/thioredoxin